MEILKPEHIAIAVKDLEEGIKFYTDVLGLRLLGRETLTARNVEVAFIECGDIELELVRPLSPQSAVAKHMEKHGESIYHLALQVDNLIDALAELQRKGIRLRDDTPRIGAGGKKIAFVEPESTHGVLLELTEKTP